MRTLTREDMRRLARAVSAASKTPIADILGKERHGRLIPPRVALMHMARQRGARVCEICRLTRRDHSTVIHHLRRVILEASPLGVEVARIKAEASALVDSGEPVVAYVPPPPEPPKARVPIKIRRRSMGKVFRGMIICDPDGRGQGRPA